MAPKWSPKDPPRCPWGGQEGPKCSAKVTPRSNLEHLDQIWEAFGRPSGPQSSLKVTFCYFGTTFRCIVVTGKARWRDAKQLDIRRARPKACVGVLWLLHSAVIPSRIPPKENPPPDRLWLFRHRAFKMASGIEVLHRRYKKSILGPLWASLGESLWCLFGHRGWPGVALDAIGMLTFCLLGPCFVRPWF